MSSTHSPLPALPHHSCAHAHNAMQCNSIAGWLEEEKYLVPDPAAEKPDEWDDEEDGEWEAPQVQNPKCKSAPGCEKWVRPTIANPQYVLG